MTLFKFICVQYQFHRRTLPIMKIDLGQILFREYVSTGTEPTRSLLACHYRSKCSMETTHKSAKVELGMKVIKLVKSLIGWEVTVTGRFSECHLTFARGFFMLLNKIDISVSIINHPE